MASRSQTVAAALVTTTIVAALGAFLWANRLASRHHGPVHLAVSGQRVVVSDSLGLSVLDAVTGTLVDQAPFDRLGLSPPLMDMQLLDDGTLLVADLPTRKLWRCGSMTERCRVIGDLAGVVGRFFKFHLDPDSHRLFVAATHANELWELRFPYDRDAAERAYEKVSAPNEIWLAPSGNLWITDTDHHRVVEVDTSRRPYSGTGRHLEGRTGLTGKTFPLDFGGTGDSSWWVLLSGHSYLDAVVVQYESDGSPLRLITLPDGSDPISVEALPDGALVADMDGFAVHFVTPEGEVSTFGDAAYQSSLSSLREQYDHYSRLAHLALTFMIAAVVAAIFVAYRAYRTGDFGVKRQTPGSASADAAQRIEPVNGIYWLAPNQRLLRLVRIISVLLIVLPVLLVLLLGFVYFLFGTADEGGSWRILIWAMAPLVAAASGFGFYFRAMSGRLFPHLGSDGKRLYARDGPDIFALVSAGQILYTDRSVQLGDRFVQLRDGYGRDIYDARQFHLHIWPVLDQGRRISEWQMFRAMLSRGHAGLWLPLILVLGLGLWWLLQQT